MKPAKVHLVGQSLLAICEILTVLGIFLLVLGIEPYIGEGTGGFILAMITLIVGGIIHAIWRILEAWARLSSAREAVV